MWTSPFWPLRSPDFSYHGHSENPPNEGAELQQVACHSTCLRCDFLTLSRIPSLELFSSEIKLRRNFIFLISRFAACLFSLTDTLFLALVLLLIRSQPTGLKQATRRPTTSEQNHLTVTIDPVTGRDFYKIGSLLEHLM